MIGTKVECWLDETPNCGGKQCGQESGISICAGPCPDGKSCAFRGTGTISCVDCSNDSLVEGDQCDLDKVECACGFDCMKTNKFESTGRCLKNCYNGYVCGDDEVCTSGPFSKGITDNVLNCYKVNKKASGVFGDCPVGTGFGIGAIESAGTAGSANMTIAIQGETLNFNECAGLYFRVDESGIQKGPVIILVDSSRKQSDMVIYYYVIGFTRMFFRADEANMSGVVTAIMRTTLDTTGAPVKSEVLGQGFGGGGSIVLTSAPIGCNKPASGIITEIVHWVFSYTCQNPDGLDCLVQMAK